MYQCTIAKHVGFITGLCLVLSTFELILIKKIGRSHLLVIAV